MRIRHAIQITIVGFLVLGIPLAAIGLMAFHWIKTDEIIAFKVLAISVQACGIMIGWTALLVAILTLAAIFRK